MKTVIEQKKSLIPGEINFLRSFILFIYIFLLFFLFFHTYIH